jgi:hypothetical protein
VRACLNSIATRHPTQPALGDVLQPIALKNYPGRELKQDRPELIRVLERLQA